MLFLPAVARFYSPLHGNAVQIGRAPVRDGATHWAYAFPVEQAPAFVNLTAAGSPLPSSNHRIAVSAARRSLFPQLPGAVQNSIVCLAGLVSLLIIQEIGRCPGRAAMSHVRACRSSRCRWQD